METLKIKLRQKVLIPLIAVMGILVVLVIFTERKVEFGKLRDQHLAALRRVAWMLDKKYDDSAGMYQILTAHLCQDPSFQQAFLAGDRDTLFRRINAPFERIKAQYGLTHLSFHQRDKTCFLRVHAPTLFGDVIDRHTLNSAITHDKPFYGFELGASGVPMLRYVAPWRVDGKVIGYIEIARQISDFVSQIKNETGFEMAVLIDKQFLQQQGQRPDGNLLENSVVVCNTLRELPKTTFRCIREDDSSKTNCTETPRFKQNDKDYIAGSFELLDAGGRDVGRVFVFSDITEGAAVIAQSSIFFGAMAVAAGVITGLFFYFYIGMIERRLREVHTEQKTEIMHRRFAEAQFKEAKDRAEAASRAKSEFLANMSHELRTPMNAIMGFSELLRDEPLTDEQLDYVRTIYASGEHLLTLINDVLDLSKIEAGKLEIAAEPCSVRKLLTQVETMMRQTAESKGLLFRVEIDESLPEEMVTDAKHLYQCLINLVGNAIKFTTSGHVILRASALRDSVISHVRFEVEDTGIGIPSDKQSLVFESFRQADTGTSRKYGGTGLGLAISRQLIELMGGTLMLLSEEGKGATFTIMLPYESPVEQQSETV
jgi:signal transduction histidine kinase